ncbi:MAG: Holliday junction resolvase RuvX [Candidatus Saccharimonadales bacterium]
MMEDKESILALDIGSIRIGIALANKKARVAHPLGALPNDDSLTEQLRKLCDRELVTGIVVGLPRGLEGQVTSQTSKIHTYGLELAKQLNVPIFWQDEALTSVKAKEELEASGKPYTKENIDALAATYILEDYLRDKV